MGWDGCPIDGGMGWEGGTQSQSPSPCIVHKKTSGPIDLVMGTCAEMPCIPYTPPSQNPHRILDRMDLPGRLALVYVGGIDTVVSCYQIVVVLVQCWLLLW